MKHSFCDVLAEKLSEQIGCRVTVIRHHIELRRGSAFRFAPYKVLRYRLNFERESEVIGKVPMTFGDMTVGQVKQTLAMLLDLINMGFIQLNKETEVEPG